jgi:hypothetical protein
VVLPHERDKGLQCSFTTRVLPPPYCPLFLARCRGVETNTTTPRRTRRRTTSRSSKRSKAKRTAVSDCYICVHYPTIAAYSKRLNEARQSRHEFYAPQTFARRSTRSTLRRSISLLPPLPTNNEALKIIQFAGSADPPPPTITSCDTMGAALWCTTVASTVSKQTG